MLLILPYVFLLSFYLRGNREKGGGGMMMIYLCELPIYSYRTKLAHGLLSGKYSVPSPEVRS